MPALPAPANAENGNDCLKYKIKSKQAPAAGKRLGGEAFSYKLDTI
jgi:hypothetical protein